MAVVFFYEGEREIDACGDARGGVDVAVAEVDGIAADLDVGVLAGEAVAELPVSDGFFTVEESSLGEQEGAGADGGDAAGTFGGFGDPLDEWRIVDAALRPRASGDDEGVDRAGAVLKWDGVAEVDAAIGAQ